MKPAEKTEAPEALSETRRNALVNLLGDEDAGVYQTVRSKILACGPSAVEWLRPHTLSREPLLRRRAQEIVRHFDRQTADDRFLDFCLRHGERFNLEQAAWLFAQTQYPDINVEAYQALLDSYTSELRDRLAGASEAPAILRAINEYLFDELGFAGCSEQERYEPENSYLNRVIDRRVGNSVSLCLIYLLLARRLHLPMAAIGLPGHFLCRYQSTANAMYVDVFQGGKFLTKADCIKYLLEGNYTVRDEYLAPLSPRRMLLRLCSQLHQVYAHLEFAEETTRLQRYLVALAR